MSAHLRCCALAASGQYVEAFSRAIEAVTAALDRAQDGDLWVVRPLVRLATGAGQLCKAAEPVATSAGRKEEFDALVDPAFVTAVRSAWNCCFNHRVPKEALHRSRKAGAIPLANMLFKLWFKLNSPRQCKFIVAAMDKDPYLTAALNASSRAGVGGRGGPGRRGAGAGAGMGAGAGAGAGSSEGSLLHIPLSQAITYRYYTGRLEMYEDAYPAADAALSFAFFNCPVDSPTNKRRILEALVPIRLHLGIVPADALLAKYGLAEQLGGIVRGVRYGDVCSFRAALEEHQDAFIRAGTYLLLERLQTLVLRTFVKRCAAHLHTNKLRFSVLAAALSSPGVGHPSYPVDVDELECLLATLVHKRLVKGYISHRPPFLVIANEKAFPSITSLAGGGV